MVALDVQAKYGATLADLENAEKVREVRNVEKDASAFALKLQAGGYQSLQDSMRANVVNAGLHHSLIHAAVDRHRLQKLQASPGRHVHFRPGFGEAYVA